MSWRAASWGASLHSLACCLQEVEQNAQLRVLHEHSEKFDLRAEGVFKYLQIFTAMANSFGHGCNNVSNAVGPLAAIYGVWLTSSVSEQSKVPVWILVLGGAGFVVGLATFGYKIMSLFGVKMTRLVSLLSLRSAWATSWGCMFCTRALPLRMMVSWVGSRRLVSNVHLCTSSRLQTSSRGFVVEFSTSIIILTAARLGLPLSTTHTLVGAVTGIGLLEGKRGLNRVLLLRFFAGWVATLVVAALTAAAFTAQGIYAPNRGLDQERYTTGTYLTSSAWSVAQAINDTATREAVLGQIMALPNWNASSPDWKPLLYLNDAVAAQQAALEGFGAPVCGSTPAGTVEC
jgi:sodium-dependent phosphate transporter